MIFSVLTIGLLLGGTISSVSAIAVPTVTVSKTVDLDRDDNGNFYAAVTSDSPAAYPSLIVDTSEDFSYEKETYYLRSWTRSTGSVGGPVKHYLDTLFANYDSAGWFGPGYVLPTFWSFFNQTNDLEMSMDLVDHVFPLAVGQNCTAVLVDSQSNFGLLNVTEPFEIQHWVLQSNQDGTTMYFGIFGPNDYLVYEGLLEGGDIQVVPVPYLGLGLYKLVIFVDTTFRLLTTINVGVFNIEPIELAAGQLVEGVLSGSEWKVDQGNGDVIYDERAPDVYTFKVQTPPVGQVGRIRYSFNEPEFTGTYNTLEPTVIWTSPLYDNDAVPLVYTEDLSSNGGLKWYQGFENESYYVSIIGQDNTEFYIINEHFTADLLPVNTIFYLDALDSASNVFAYNLHLETDSIIAINSTEYSSGFSWNIETIKDGVHYEKTIGDYNNFGSIYPVYLPAGDYLLTATPLSIFAYGQYYIHLNPVLDGDGIYTVDDSSFLNVRVPTAGINTFIANISLMTEANVSTTLRIHIFTPFGDRPYLSTETQGHVKSGYGWEVVGENKTSIILGMNGVHLDGDYAILSIAPYDTKNTTTGSPTNKLKDVVHTFAIDTAPYQSEWFNGTATMDASSGSASTSFPFDESQELYEYYLVHLTAAPNTWYNVSVASEDVDDIEVSVYQPFHEYTQTIPWYHLDDTMVGTNTDFDVFFGTVSDDVYLSFFITRSAAVQPGYLNITLTPLVTNQLELIDYESLSLPSVGGNATIPPGTDWLADNGLVIAGGVGVVAVVVVVLVVLKKKGSI